MRMPMRYPPPRLVYQQGHLLPREATAAPQTSTLAVSGLLPRYPLQASALRREAHHRRRQGLRPDMVAEEFTRTQVPFYL